MRSDDDDSGDPSTSAQHRGLPARPRFRTRLAILGLQFLTGILNGITRAIVWLKGPAAGSS
jgi:hypothetical protein